MKIHESAKTISTQATRKTLAGGLGFQPTASYPPSLLGLFQRPFWTLSLFVSKNNPFFICNYRFRWVFTTKSFFVLGIQSRAKFSYRLTKIILRFKSLYQLARIAGQSQVASKKVELAAWNAKRFKLIGFVIFKGLLVNYRSDSIAIPRLLKLLVKESLVLAPLFNVNSTITIAELIPLLN